MDALHEFLTEAFFAVAYGCEGPEDRAEHDDVENVITDLIHCFALLLYFAKRQKANRRLHQAGRKPALSGVTVFFTGGSASRWRGSRWLYRGRTHARSAPVLRLEETERVDVVADQQVLGLL
ncbi:hypothetical protein, partial [Stutzerimonas nitrititolerans]|uniref:hypothetical protein n=1 Tax=Stutzerimonas nitrititolerans TaxID=2482751 RepID=UPI0028A87258